jgi:heat shock protein HslJ
MKRIIFPTLTLLVVISCSPKLSPDHDWNARQWVLTEIKGVPVQLSGTGRDAHLEFNTAEKKYSGSAGCNRIAGSYSLEKKNAISFSDPVTTRMSCPDLAFEDLFLATLKTVNRQSEEGNQLILKKGNDVVLKLQAK